MPVEPELNKILKEMWRLDEKRVLGEALQEEELVFYNTHLEVIQNYYESNHTYWTSRNPI